MFPFTSLLKELQSFILNGLPVTQKKIFGLTSKVYYSHIQPHEIQYSFLELAKYNWPNFVNKISKEVSDKILPFHLGFYGTYGKGWEGIDFRQYGNSQDGNRRVNNYKSVWDGATKGCQVKLMAYLLENHYTDLLLASAFYDSDYTNIVNHSDHGQRREALALLEKYDLPWGNTSIANTSNEMFSYMIEHSYKITEMEWNGLFADNKIDFIRWYLDNAFDGQNFNPLFTSFNAGNCSINILEGIRTAVFEGKYDLSTQILKDYYVPYFGKLGPELYFLVFNGINNINKIDNIAIDSINIDDIIVLFDYLRVNHCPMDKEIIKEFVKCGDAKILAWLIREFGHRYDKTLTKYALLNNPDFLEKLFLAGCIWHKDSWKMAIKGGSYRQFYTYLSKYPDHAELRNNRRVNGVSTNGWGLLNWQCKIIRKKAGAGDYEFFKWLIYETNLPKFWLNVHLFVRAINSENKALITLFDISGCPKDKRVIGNYLLDNANKLAQDFKDYILPIMGLPKTTSFSRL